jgi:XTP/dITP diphosphohydrolase
MPPILVLGTRNAKKRKEIEDILAGLDLLLQDLSQHPTAPEVVEDGDTFEANARKKASETARAVGQWALGEDSGLVVPILDGRPGIYSARYAGEGASDEANLAKLLREVDAAAGDRRAAYVCAIALVDEGGHEYVFEATCEGTLLREGRGSGGFGYDPVFVPDETGHNDHRTFSELSPEEKHAVSHRGKATRMLARHLGLEAEAAP